MFGRVTSRSHLRPSLPPPASAEPLPAFPELGPTPPPPAGYVGLGRPPQPRPANGKRGRKTESAGELVCLMTVVGLEWKYLTNTQQMPLRFGISTHFVICSKRMIESHVFCSSR